MATTTLGSKLRLKHVWWLLVPLALVLAVLTAFVAGTTFNLGSRSFGLSIQTLMPNGPFYAEGFFIHTGWDGPTGSFSTGDIYGLKVGNRLLRLDIVDDPIAAAKRKLPATVDELVTALNSRDGWLRLCALERLAELGAAAVPAIPALVKRIENGNEQAAGTLSAVSKSSPDKAVPLLMEALGNSSVDVRWRVAELLGEIGPPASNAIPVLTVRLDDPEPKVVGHAALRTIAGMVLLHFRVHRTGVDDFARSGRDPRWVAFQRHTTLRTITRFVRLHAGAHWAEVFRGARRLHRCGAVLVMRMTVMRVVVSGVTCLAAAATTGTADGLVASTTSAGWPGWGEWNGFRRPRLPHELLPTVLTAKVMRLAITLGAESRRLADRHAADGVFGHNSTFVVAAPDVSNCLHSPSLTRQRRIHYTGFLDAPGVDCCGYRAQLR